VQGQLMKGCLETTVRYGRIYMKRLTASKIIETFGRSR